MRLQAADSSNEKCPSYYTHNAVPIISNDEFIRQNIPRYL